ncbi:MULTISPECIES: non-hemolytic enterotoxin subunit B [unclassified Bacillus (in: firmicutes)]|uniref:non-hemolytic enterotoxin subunit B n=1 Tax=unclassified Bacillus (in: firmicutes) TaxID=185979 RepID=UPI0030102896
MKKPYKVMALSTLIATIVAGSITPSYASAAEDTTKSVPNYTDAADNYPEYSLGPQGLQDALTKTGSNMLVMDLYALTILKQANVNLDGLTTINNDLQNSLKYNQDVARQNAKQWLDGIKPQIIQTNQNIISYNQEFQSYYDILVEAAKDQDKETLQAVLKELINSISAYQGTVNKLAKDLGDLRTKLGDDTRNLKGNAGQITDILAGEKQGIPAMKKQIEANYTLIDENNKVYIGSSVATALGAYLVATIIFAPIGAGGLGGGIYGVVTSQQQIKQAQEEIKRLTQNISTAEQQVVRLTTLEKNTNNLTATIDTAITAVEKIKDQWTIMGSQYQSLYDIVGKVKPDQIPKVVGRQLEAAQKSWNLVSNHAKNIQNSEIKFVEGK